MQKSNVASVTKKNDFFIELKQRYREPETFVIPAAVILGQK